MLLFVLVSLRAPDCVLARQKGTPSWSARFTSYTGRR